MSHRFDLDLLVIGGGSGGVRAARVAAQYGARVALVEEAQLGGTCVNVGCVPKKLLVYAAHVRDELDDAAGFGWTIGERRFDWRTLIENKDREIQRLNDVYLRLLTESGVQVEAGRVRLVDRHTIEIATPSSSPRRAAGRHVTAERLLVCPGGRPWKPPVPGAEHAITSNEAFHLRELPLRVTIVGGGYIALEFAGIFEGLGSRVTLVHRGPLFLRGFDHDLRAELAAELRRREVDLRFDADVVSIERSEGALVVALRGGERVATDLVLFAVGRVPNTAGMGLQEAGVQLDDEGAVVVDAYSRTSVDNIWAVGDVTNRVSLTPVALAEGQAFAETVYGGNPTRPDHDAVPSAVFSSPPLATVGLTEEEARATGAAIVVYTSQFRPLKSTLSGRGARTLMKLVVDRATDRVLGAHMLGPDAPEIIQGVAIAVKVGATKRDFDRTIGIHPTAAEEFVTMRTPRPDPPPTTTPAPPARRATTVDAE